MRQDVTLGGESSEEPELYTRLLQLEELETLLEELEDCVADGNPVELPVDLRERLRELGVSNADDVRRHIAQFHARLDDSE